MEIVSQIYTVTREFPKDERFGLTSQMRRAAVSIPSNVSEGFSRVYNKEFGRFLYMAIGSCSELETQIEISFSLKLIPEQVREELVEKLDHESRMIRNLIKKLHSKES